MPVVLVRAILAIGSDLKDAYLCPVYATEARFRQEVFVAQLRTKQSWIKWTLAGVALVLDAV
jgi:dynein heavy chain, axonemal